MAAFCLPRALVASFNQEAVPGGKLDPHELNRLESPDRRARLAEVVGAENATQLNAAFEKKLLLKYKDGFEDWINESTIPPAARQNIVDKIAGINEKILNPANRKEFLEDLAAEALKTKVTMEESRQIFQMARNAQDMKDAWERSLLTQPTHDEFTAVMKGDGANLSSEVRQAARDRYNYFKAVGDLRDTINSLKPNGKTFVQRMLNWGGKLWLVPKTLQTGILHFSAFDVQLWGSWSESSVRTGFLKQLSWFADEENYNFTNAWIMTNKYYDLAVRNKLGLTDLSDKAVNREENIPSSLLQDVNEKVAEAGGKLTGQDRLPVNLVAASSRAFTGYQNYVRANVFYNLIEGLKRKDPEIDLENSKLVYDAADTVNNFTGRANLAYKDKWAILSPVLNGIFFAPRKAVAIAQMFNPGQYVRLYAHAIEAGYDKARDVLDMDDQLTPIQHVQLFAEAVRQGNYVVANHAVKNVLSSLVITGSLLYLAQASQPLTGYSSHFKPWDQNFGTITTENGERLGPAGGVATWLRLIGQLTSGRYINREGANSELDDGYHATTREELIDRWVRNKLGSTAGAVADWVFNATAIGQSPSVSVEAREHLLPILASTIFNYWYDQPDKSWSDLPMLLFLVGGEVESPLPQTTRQGYTFWGEQTPMLHDPVRDRLDARMSALGVYESMPTDTIKGVKLDDQKYPGAYQEYIQMFGQKNAQFIANLFESPGFNGLSKTQQQHQVKRVIAMSRALAQNKIQTDFPQIMVESNKLKQAREGITTEETETP